MGDVLHQCGRGEGAEATSKLSGGECAKGGKHVFKFGKCTKCGAAEGALVPKQASSNELESAFATFDTDGSGAISAAELKAVLCAHCSCPRIDEALDQYVHTVGVGPLPTP